MLTQCSRDLFGYEVVEGRQVVAAFDGGDNLGRRRAVARRDQSRNQSGRAADAAPDTVGNDRAEAALRRVTAPCRDAAWRSDGLSRLIHAARFEVCCERAARVLGYRPRFDLAAGIAATEAAIAAALEAVASPRPRPEKALRAVCANESAVHRPAAMT